MCFSIGKEARLISICIKLEKDIQMIKWPFENRSLDLK